MEYPYIVKRSEKFLDYGWAHLLCQDTACCRLQQQSKVNVLALAWQTTLQNDLNNCCSGLNRTISLSITSSDCQVHVSLSYTPHPAAAYRGKNLCMGAGTADSMWVQYILGVFWTKTTQLTSSRPEVGLSSSRRFHHGYIQSFNPKQLSSCPQGSYKIVAGKVQSEYSGYNHCRLHPSLVFLLTADHRSGQNRRACIDTGHLPMLVYLGPSTYVGIHGTIYLCWYTWDHLPMLVYMGPSTYVGIHGAIYLCSYTCTW